MYPCPVKFSLILIWLCLGAASAWAGSPDSLRLRRELERERLRNPSLERYRRESRILYYLGRRTDGEAATPYFAEGRQSAVVALSFDPRDVAARFWWAANEGELAAANRDLSSLSSLRAIEKTLGELKEARPEFGFAAPERALGRVYQEAPSWFIGSMSEAETQVRAAVRRFPDFPGNKLELALFLERKGEVAEATRLAKEVRDSVAYQKNDFGDFSIEKPDWEATVTRLVRLERAP